LPSSERQHRQEEDLRTIERLRDQGTQLCLRFRLRYKSIDAERDGVVEHYGICYEDGLILIRLRHAKTGRLLKESSLVDTLCHELAHLRHLDHSARFRKLYWKILEAARELGYYRPGPVTDGSPRQLDLFDPGACGAVAATSRRER